jgi:hypothetical protein
MSWIFLAIALVIVAKSPLGLALAHRIRYGAVPAGASDGRLEELATQVNEDITALRAELTEVAERMDFAERALLQLRRPDAPPQVRAGEREAGTA